MANAPQLQDATRLQEIAADFYGGRLTREASREAVIDVVLARIACARVSLWRFEADAAQLRLVCVGAKSAGSTLETEPHALDIEEFRDYFNVIAEHGVFVADDATTDAALQAMRERYLERFHVLSMLDAAFLLNGRAFAVICCEETEAPRRWKPAEVQALRAIVTRIALLMSSHADPALWDLPSLPMQPLGAPG